jgi:hypothetical protein
MNNTQARQVLDLCPDVFLISSTEIADRLSITVREARTRKRAIRRLGRNKLTLAAMRLGLSESEVEAIGAANVLGAVS